MPTDPADAVDRKDPEKQIGLALSGGGFRATLFHLGALWRLNETRLLNKLTLVSSVSGGSIAAAYLGLKWNKLSFESGVAANFEDLVVSGLRNFCSKTIDFWAILRVLPRPWAWRRAGNSLATLYRRQLFGDATIQDLPDIPRFIILSTNLLAGVPFQFTKERFGDYVSGHVPHPEIQLADCVAASSAFPPVLSPFRLPFNTVGGGRKLHRSGGGKLHTR